MNNRPKQTKQTHLVKSNGNMTVSADDIPSTPSVKPCKKRDRHHVENVTSMNRFVRFKSAKSEVICSKIKTIVKEEKSSVVGIAYRPDKEGAGAVFDHQTFQLVTDRPTVMLNANNIPRPFDKSLRERPNFLKYGNNTIDNTGFKFPPVANQENDNVGL